MKKVIFFFLSFNILPLMAQDGQTFHFLTNTEYTIPIVFSNINSIKCTLYRNDEKLDGHIRVTYDFGVDLEKTTSKDNAFMGEIFDIVYTAGLYKYKCEYTVTNSFSQSEEGAIINNVIVDYPKLSSPDVDRDTLFIGENFSFSIAAIGYDDTSKYKYVVSFGDQVRADTVYGNYIVNLSKYLIPENVGKILTLTAFYNSTQFKYYTPDNKLIKPSTWSFTLKSPELIKSYRWTREDTLVALDNNHYSIIKLFYEDMDNNKTITVVPKEARITNFTTNNEDVFSLPSVTKGTNIFVVLLNINKDNIEPFTLEDGHFSFDFVTEIGSSNISNNLITKIYKTR